MFRACRIAAPLVVAALAASAAPSNGASTLRSDAPVTNVTQVGQPAPSKQTALARIQQMVARLNKEAETPAGEAAVVARLAGQYRVSPDTLRAQKNAWGLHYGEVAMAYGFARASRKPGTTPERVVELRRSGMEWKSIAKQLGVQVDAVASRMKRHVGPKR